MTDEKPTLMDDLENLARQHIGKIIVGGGSTVLSVVSAVTIWFAGEYQATNTRGMLTEKTLEAHTLAERENYESLMTVLDELQHTTTAIRQDVAVLKYRMDARTGSVPVNAVPKQIEHYPELP